MTPRDFIKHHVKKSILSRFPDFDKNVADARYLWSDSEPGRTQVESMLKIMRVAVENSSFGYKLTSEILRSEGLGFLA